MPVHEEDLLERLRWELQTGLQAWQEGNAGKARVCARRAVAWLVQALPPPEAPPYGSHVGENLRRIANDPQLPDKVRQAAQRLQGGARAQLQGELWSLYPLHDAGIILCHFARSFGIGEKIVELLRQLQLCTDSSACSASSQ